MMRLKGLLIVAGVLALAVAAAAGWYFLSPLFIDDTVDEALPFDSPVTPEAPDRQEVAAMEEEEQESLRVELEATAAAMPDKEMDEAMPEGAEQTAAEPIRLAEGSFVDADSFHQGSGTATIYDLGGGERVLRLEDFEVTNGPDLHVILSKHPAPASRGDVGDDYVDLGELKGNIGSQNYTIPEGVDLSIYQSVVIYCVPFHVVFSTATLS